MDPPVSETASQSLRTLRQRLVCILKEDADGLLDELHYLLPLSEETYKALNTAGTEHDRVEKILSLILEEGEQTCVKFIQHLENMVLRFPRLSGLSGNFPDMNVCIFYEFMEKLRMEEKLKSKLTLQNMLSLSKDNLNESDPQNIEDIPWYSLRKLMALNRNARNTRCTKTFSNVGSSVDHDIYNAIFEFNSINDSNDASPSLHPLDVVCALLHCSDHFLQQELVSKMSMCQFAVPLLLPAGEGTDCTLMLWAMRDIVKRWRPHSLADSKGFMEDNVVNVPMPTFSFVRLGKSKLSKSKILNQVLSQDQQHQDFFIHDNMEGGNIQRKISNGLVEMSWYFPSGSKSSDIFPEPIAVTNLRGDLESNWDQFRFLTRVSSAVFIFTERIGEREFRLLSTCDTSDTQYYFIISPNPGRGVNMETPENMEKIKKILNTGKAKIILKKNTDNDGDLAKKIKLFINCSISNVIKKKIQSMDGQTCELGIKVDESIEECLKAKKQAEKITKEIKDVALYKKKTMVLQGDPWKEISKIEKEICRMKKLGTRDVQQYHSELRRQRVSLHEKQNRHNLPRVIEIFVEENGNRTTEKYFFFKCMKFELDLIARNTMSALQAEYRKKINDKNNQRELKQLDQKISDNSLGIEHFLREMGQFYEAECVLSGEEQIHGIEKKYTRLPGLAADLLLDGFPLELIDGDASNIPLRWITDVLTELDTKTGGRCRMRVISVLGVQSTGKSTLLNTMFGLQFPVASGRCTRGAFMTLIRVEEDFIEELGCDFILVIDTEGLKAPELASLEGSYEHDNELATLVIGLSDITIINMAMENTAEMKDILQIVVHAFLRMKEIGKKPKCLFVHQNVSDVSIHENIMRDRKKLKDLLDGMTTVVANMENKREVTFNDIIELDIEKDSWYIPGLWLGVPPMAAVSPGYSENVSELKKYLLNLMKTFKSVKKPHNISEFIKWVESLWNAVKHERFIFSFRNSLVAQAYNKLSIQFSQWEWDFTKAVNSWVSNTETLIRNQSPDTLKEETITSYKDELHRTLCVEERKMKKNLKRYFEENCENVNLIEKYKEEFLQSVQFLKHRCERRANNKVYQISQIQKWKFEIQRALGQFPEILERKVMELLETCGKRSCRLNDAELKMEFETMWDKTVSDLQITPLPKRDVRQSMLQQVYKDMSDKGPEINEKLTNMKSLEEYQIKSLDMFKQDLFSLNVCDQELWAETSAFIDSQSLIYNPHFTEKVDVRSDYDDTYCQDLLHCIDEKLQEVKAKKLPISSLFELEVKLFVLARAAPGFQTMHEDYIQENDPMICLEKLKPEYFENFRSIFEMKDQSKQRAKQFCDTCLKPALTEYVYRHLGQEIVEDMLNSSDNVLFMSRFYFQAAVLQDLLEKGKFQSFHQYINGNKCFLKTWIKEQISEKYRKPSQLETLQADVLSAIIAKIQRVLPSAKCQNSPNIHDFLKNFREEFGNLLVISQNTVNVVAFGNTADVAQFSGNIQSLLSETENQILSELKRLDINSVLSKVTLKPEDELLEKVMGCGEQCPFCKVPCEAGGSGHTEHFASIHRPEGLGTVSMLIGKTLCTGICSNSVISSGTFISPRDGAIHQYKKYREVYPDWAIQPDPSIQSSDYWKYVFVKFNEEFAEEYKAKPAELPEGWKEITREQALRSLKDVFNVKQ